MRIKCKTLRCDLMGIFSVLCFVFSMSSCVGETPTPVVMDTIDAFLQAMGEMGVQATIIEQEGPVIMDLSPTSVRLGDEQLLIYSSSENLDAVQVLEHIDQDSNRQYLWVGEHLILRYSGNDGGTVLLVESLFGDPITGPSASGDEPYPPAIPAAIQAVAAGLSVEPTDVEVLDYELVEWPNACLGFENVDEVCGDAPEQGWRIVLRKDNTEIEVHTDMLGLNIRWH